MAREGGLDEQERLSLETVVADLSTTKSYREKFGRFVSDYGNADPRLIQRGPVNIFLQLKTETCAALLVEYIDRFEEPVDNPSFRLKKVPHGYMSYVWPSRLGNGEIYADNGRQYVTVVNEKVKYPSWGGVYLFLALSRDQLTTERKLVH